LTVDLACASGAQIPIEFRDAREITDVPFAELARAERAGTGKVEPVSAPAQGTRGEPAGRQRWVPEGVGVLNPAFDVTPAAYVTRLFTERGVFTPAQIRSAGPCAVPLPQAPEASA
jgi:methylthioribose-1-phosphate isomerase